MKFIRYCLENEIIMGVLDAAGSCVISMADVIKNKDWGSMQSLISNLTKEDIVTITDAVQNKEHYPYIQLEKVTLCAPIEKPVHDILCVGVNYSEHLAEAQKELNSFQKPAHTVYFSKRALRLLGSGDSIHSCLELDEALDYEVELAVIIGRRGKNIKKEQAEDYIFGYSVFNDISSRNIQRQHGQWFKGKSLDSYAAMGPVILHKSALPLPVQADVISMVNGEVRQHSNTSMFLTDIPTIIAELSAGMTLEEGDIIATGTPSGVGMGFQPPKYLQRGDTVICEIPQIGKLVNRVE